MTERFGVVGFVDGGQAFENSNPDFDQALGYGAGLGIRYFTPIGPVRLDLARPIGDSEGVSTRLRVYVSLGQAF